MFEILRGSPGRTGQLTRILLTPLAAIPNGVCLLALYIGLAAGAMLWFVRTRSVHAFTAALVGIAACLLQIESGLIYSLYFVNYHNYLAFYAMFVTLLASQALVNIGWHAVLRAGIA